MLNVKSALFLLSLLLIPAAASAQAQDGILCHLLPSLCERESSVNAVPELDTNAAGAAGALLLGASLLLTSRRRRTA